MIILTILGAIAAIFLVVLVHEWGHFFVARKLGVHVIKFSIGFGKALYSYTSQKTGTQYAISIIPLGGYVKMYGEQGDLSSEERMLDKGRYMDQPALSRMAIALAGPLANIIFAVILFFAVYLMGITYVRAIVGEVTPQSMIAKAGIVQGDEILQINGHSVYGWQQVLTELLTHIGDTKAISIITQKQGVRTAHQLDLSGWTLKDRNPDVIKSLGFNYQQIKIRPVVEAVIKDGPAASAGIQKGDRIVQFNGEVIADWVTLLNTVQQQPGKTVSLVFVRQGKTHRVQLQVATKHNLNQSYGYLGVEVKYPPIPPQLLQTIQYSFSEAFVKSIEHTGSLLGLNFKMMLKMFSGSVSMNTLGGPISVFKTAGEASQAGLSIYLSFIAFVSVSLGFINLLPIPMLDGGHVLFQLIELVLRRPVPLNYQVAALKLGAALIVWMMLQATLNDILRLV